MLCNTQIHKLVSLVYNKQVLNFLMQTNPELFFLVQIDVPYVEETVAISEYPLSGALTCAKICGAFEEAWGIL